MRVTLRMSLILLVLVLVAACSHHEAPSDAEVARTLGIARQMIHDPFAVEPEWYRDLRKASYSVSERVDQANSTLIYTRYVPVLTPEFGLPGPAVMVGGGLAAWVMFLGFRYGLTKKQVALAFATPHVLMLVIWSMIALAVLVFGGGKYYARSDFAIFLSYIILSTMLLGILLRWRVRQAAAGHQPTVLVCGATGVGKSTLINALAGRDEAQTGIGAPVTQNTTYIPVPERELAFYDSRGLEVEEASETYFLLLADLLHLRYRWRIEQQIDAVLICIQEPQGRIDEAHLEIANLCNDLGIPYGIAITKTQDEPELAEKAHEMFPAVQFVIQVRALELRLRAVTIPPKNLDLLEQKLREISSWSLVAARKRAFSALKTHRLATVARSFATRASRGTAWVSFAAAAFELMGRARRSEYATWEAVRIDMRSQIRRDYVPNAVIRILLTKFDDHAIDQANAMRILARIIRRFGDGTLRLTSDDLEEACAEARVDLDHKRPYRSRV